MDGWSRKARAFALGVVATSIVGAWVLLRTGTSPTATGVFGFAVLIVLAEAAPVELSHASYSVGFVVALAAIIALGPGGAALAAAAGAIDNGLRTRKDWPGRLVFNAAQLSLSTSFAGLVYKLLGGPVGTLRGGSFPAVLLPTLGATAAYFVANVTLVSTMLSLLRGVPWSELWQRDYKAASISHFGFAALGLLLALLYLNTGWGTALFLLLPLLVARGAFHASARRQDAFDATLRSLVTAIEAKDLYTRGHAERVSRLAAMVARERRLPSGTVRRIQYAALMHDVGKLTIDTKVLQKPGKLSVEEFEHMKVHPIRGSEIVSEIDLLAEMVDGIRHHHERMDGRGYPDGLAGEQLSMVARLIMVCDAFDSMTSTRSYRRAMPVESAIAELRRCQGSQFDTHMIDALEIAIGKNRWIPAPEEFEGEKVPRPELTAHVIAR